MSNLKVDASFIDELNRELIEFMFHVKNRDAKEVFLTATNLYQNLEKIDNPNLKGYTITDLDAGYNVLIECFINYVLMRRILLEIFPDTLIKDISVDMIFQIHNDRASRENRTNLSDLLGKSLKVLNEMIEDQNNG